MIFDIIRVFMFFILAIIFVCLFYIYLMPSLVEHQQVLDQGDKIALKVLNSTSASCDDLTKLRVSHIQGLEFHSYLVDQLRDLYNAKGCGTHWGWFEG